MIALGELIFDPATTAVVEKHKEVGGRDARTIRLTGLLENLGDPDTLEDALDDVLRAASLEAGLVPLVLRANRHMMVRRVAFAREVMRPGAAARFTLDLEAPDPFEYADAEGGESWFVGNPGKNVSVTAGGNAPTPLRFTLSPNETVDNPRFFDSARSIVYPGDVREGQTLTVDGILQQVLLDGEDITHHTLGVFPRVSPGANMLSFAGDNVFSGTMTAAWRDRWW